jgi:hypothetical protein
MLPPRTYQKANSLPQSYYETPSPYHALKKNNK